MSRSRNTSDASPQSTGASQGRFAISGPVILIFTLCIVTTLAIWRGMTRQESRYIEQRFDEHVDRSRFAVAKTLKAYEECLLAARAMLAASDNVNSIEFRTYVEQLDIRNFLPGMIGLGIIHRVPGEALDEFVDSQRRAHSPDFKVTPPGRRDEHWILTYLEPTETSGTLRGFDTRTEPVRRAALELARDCDKPILSRKVRIPVPSEEVDAVVLALPMFSSRVSPATVEERRACCVGWVALAVRLDRFLDAIPAFAERHLECRLIDAEAGADPMLLFENGGGRRVGGSAELVSRKTMDLAGRSWILEVRALPDFAASEGAGDTPRYALVCGLLVSTLISMIVWSISTTRSRAEALARRMTVAFRTSEAEARKLALVASRTSNSVVLTDAQGRIEWANEGFTRITEYALHEVIGRKPGHFLQGPRTDPATVAYMRRQIARGEGFHVEIVNYSRSGREYWIEAEVQPIVDANGTLTSFMAIQSEITDRKKAEQALRESELRYRTLVANIPEAVYRCAFDDERSMEYISDAIQDLCGFPAAALIGNRQRTYASFIHPEDRGRVEMAIRRAVGRREPYFLEYRLVHRDGAIRWASEKGQAAYDEEGNVLWLDGAIGNATLRKKAETELREYNAALVKAYNALAEANRLTEAATRAKSEFLANMSHEIRTPMTAILGYTDILIEEGRLDPELRQTLVTIKRNGEHLLEIINDILDLSKIEAGKLSVERIACSPARILSEVYELMKVRAEAKKLAFTTSCEGPMPPFISTDPTRLRQILINLIGNALKFTSSGSVRVVMRMADADAGKPRIRFDVIDTGIGLSEEQTRNLFQAFTQADSSMTRRYGGTGLGLAVSKRLAQILGGDISVSSVPGRGSTFSLTVAADHAGSAEQEADQAVGTAAKKGPRNANESPQPCAIRTSRPLDGFRILVVEDGADNQRLITHILSRAGARVEIAENGRVAVSMIKASARDDDGSARRGGFDLTLMDMQMPEIDGYEATRILRGLGYHRPIIALTAHAMAGDREKCLAAGCDDYVAKPIDRRRLVEKVVGCLASAAAGSRAAEELSSVQNQVQVLTRLCEGAPAPAPPRDAPARRKCSAPTDC